MSENVAAQEDYMNIFSIQVLDVELQTDSITVDVVIEEDTIDEGIEEFMVSLAHDSVPYTVTLGIATLSVVIIDNESKLLHISI